MSSESFQSGFVENGYVSTGHLPTPDDVQSLVAKAYQEFKRNREGQNSQVYPALSRVPSDLFGICVAGTSGNVYAAGDVDYEFTIMSVSKPFIFALICDALGADQSATKSVPMRPASRSIR